MTHQSWCRVMTSWLDKPLPFGGEVEVDILDMVAMVGSLHHNEISVDCDLENTMIWKHSTCLVSRSGTSSFFHCLG